MAEGPIAVIRYAEGKVDDVAISGDLFRMEQMDSDLWFVAVSRGRKRVAFFLSWDKKIRRIVATLSEDEIGCVDDSRRASE